MVIFNSYVKLPEGRNQEFPAKFRLEEHNSDRGPMVPLLREAVGISTRNMISKRGGTPG